MKYPISFPLAWVFSLLGVPIIIRIEFCFDPDAEVFIATSTDIPGLVIEAETFIDLRDQVEEAIPNLLFMDNNKKLHKTSADVVFKNHIALA
ncbi:MAG: DUF1902 domain-containing protein [Methylococcales symbiont of Hymedesmia sp. n. MRB-2018]|nr:MAG: DUF1902 domain-containing protein [Methylococcales symbiont of Hymedesmia sp. n. MRB-2018]